MSLVEFNKDGSLLECTLEVEGHRVRLSSESPIIGIRTLIEDGFKELNEHSEAVMMDFSDERYLYHEEVEGHVFVITNEENDIWTPQAYVAPIIESEPAPYVPSLDEVKEEKISELERMMESLILQGVTITLSDSTTETFSLSTQDQIFLTNLRLMAEDKADQETPSIPWHEADESKQCKFYAPIDIIAITDAARDLITYQVTFFRDLRIYIRSLSSVEAVKAVSYDISSLPQAFWSDVLRSILSE
jgi:hypothetical protein